MVSAKLTTAVPSVCRAAVCINSGPDYKLVLKEDFPVPVPGRGELLVKLNATGICLSDHHYMEGDWVAGKMTGRISCVGHEGAGEVVALGPDVDPRKWQIGARVGMKPIWSICHDCDQCRDGYETHCEDRQWAAFHKDGSYAEYVVLNGAYTNRLPDNVPDAYAGPVMCSGATIWAALRASSARAGQWVVVPGAGGGVGHMAVQYARAMGLRVIAIDTGDSKKEMCLRLGAEAFIDFKLDADTAQKVKEITGKGAHAVIVTGGTKAAYAGILRFLRTGGTVVGVGLPPKETAFFGGYAEEIIRQRLTVTGTLVGSSSDVDQALDFVARGIVVPQVTVKPFEYFPQAVKDLVESKVVGRLVVNFRD